MKMERTKSSRTLIRPDRSLGQNFLIDGVVADHIVDLIPHGTKRVIEVGPGYGSLTQRLIDRGYQTLAIEIDPILAGMLKEMTSQDSLEVIVGDALEIIRMDILKMGDHIISNLPFYISSRFILLLLDIIPLYHDIYSSELTATIMLQSEFAQRLTSKVGDSSYGRLSVIFDLELEALDMMTVERDRFDPVPSVDAKVIRIQRKPVEIPKDLDRSRLNRLLDRCFDNRRKKLKNIISHYLSSEPCVRKHMNDYLINKGISELRPERLTTLDFLELEKQMEWIESLCMHDK